ncbi:hypothetical protein HK405_013509, partial [Cladochytrium tenue]
SLHGVTGSAARRDAAEKALDAPVEDALGATLEGRRLWVAWEDAPLFDAIGPLTEGVHRLVVPAPRGGSGPALHLCTQLDVVAYLYRVCDDDSVLAAKVDSTLLELGLVVIDEEDDEDAPAVAAAGDGDAHARRTSSVLSAHPTWRSSRAVRLMASNELQALALTDGDGRLVGALSLADLARAPHDALFEDDPTVEELVCRARASGDGEAARSLSELAPPVRAHADDTLRHVMGRVVETRAHRCWIVDSRGVLIDVVTLTNILQVDWGYPRESATAKRRVHHEVVFAAEPGDELGAAPREPSVEFAAAVASAAVAEAAAARGRAAASPVSSRKRARSSGDGGGLLDGGRPASMAATGAANDGVAGWAALLQALVAAEMRAREREVALQEREVELRERELELREREARERAEERRRERRRDEMLLALLAGRAA